MLEEKVIRYSQQGFTFLELMISGVIIGILATIAYPSYQSQIQASRRSDAIKALLAAQLAEEQWRANNTSYTTSLTDLDISATSPDGYYTISVTSADATAYTIEADPTGMQAGDTDCDPMTINQDGVKTPTDGCW